MVKTRTRISVFFAILVLSLATVTMTACGDGPSSDYLVLNGNGGGGGGGVVPPAAVGRVVFNFVLLRSVPANVTDIRFTGMNAAGAPVFGPETQAKAATITLNNVPTTVTNFRTEFLAGATVVGAGMQAVVVPDGGTVAVTDPNFNDRATYVGSLACNECHQSYYTDFRESAHPFKVTKVLNGQAPTYPFSDPSPILGMLADDGEANRKDKDGNFIFPGNGTATDNELGTPQSWADVSYVIGGFGWKARLIDLNGFIVTGATVQYNLDTQAMSGYHNDEKDKVFNCGNCHTTGWRHFDAALNNARQDNLPGMDGTFAEQGIQCESCHGAGGLHVMTRNAADITKLATPRTAAQLQAPDAGYGLAVACGECHTRDGERDYPTYVSAGQNAGHTGVIGGRIAASGGFVRHHEQYDETLAINPDDVAAGSTRGNFSSTMWDCNTCHNPHKSTIYNQASNVSPRTGGGPGVKGSNADCMACHPGNDPTASLHPSMGSLNCIDCHMPLFAKSADTNAGGADVIGDIKSHIFHFDLTKGDQQFTADGKYAYPWLTQRACKECHNGVRASDRTAQDFSAFRFHKL